MVRVGYGRRIAPGRLVALVAGLVATALAAFVPATADAATPTTLALTSVGAVVVDDAHSLVFVSEGPAGGLVAAVGFDGKVKKTFTDMAGPTGMVLRGGMLYVAQGSNGQIARIDTAALTKESPLTTGLTNPLYLAAAGGRLWVSGGCSTGPGWLDSIDWDSGAVRVETGPDIGACGGLASPGPDSSDLVAWATGSPTWMYRINTTGSGPTVEQSVFQSELSGGTEVAFADDGDRFYTAAGGRYQIDAWSMASLNRTGERFVTGPYPQTVAYNATGGGLVAAGISFSDPAVRVYEAGAIDGPAWTSTLSGALYRPGLAWSADGTRLFALTGYLSSTVSLEVLKPFAPADPDPTTSSTTSSSTTTTTGPGSTTTSTTTTTTAPPASGQGGGGLAGTTPLPLRVSPTTVDFGQQRVGSYGDASTVTVSNPLNRVVNVEVAFDRAVRVFGGVTDCQPTLPALATCTVALRFVPDRFGHHSALMSIRGDGVAAAPVALSGQGVGGYWIATDRGEVAALGDAFDYGDLREVNLARPIVGIAASRPIDETETDGFWLVADDGGVFAFGDARFYGSTGAVRLNQPIVGMAMTPTGKGYWLVARDGGIFAFGDAGFFGSTGGIRLNQAVLGMAATPTGKGYWLFAGDGGIFAFGDARFYGSTGGTRLNRPIVGMTTLPTGGGYWMVASDGGIFAFGDARFHGSTGATRLDAPIASMGPSPTGGGYWLVGRDGSVFPFGDTPAYGAAAPAAAPVVGIAATTYPVTW